MKKLTRKLFLSVAALAVCAATLVSTTFAWYVSNQTATATVEGSTAAITGAGSVFISKDGVTFLRSVTFEDSDFAVDNDFDNVRNEFLPTTSTDGIAFKQMDGTTPDEGKWLTFSVWLKADRAARITPTLLLTNVENLPAQKANQDITSSLKAGAEYKIDAAQALRMSIKTNDAASAKIYDVMSLAKVKNGENLVPYSLKEGSVNEEQLLTADYTIGEVTKEDLTGAHLYYAQTMGEFPGTTEPAAAQDSWGYFDLEADTAYKLTFTFWLEGADVSCFDGCAGQDFKFDFDFTASAIPTTPGQGA